jgi:hypothetical protein
LDNRRSPNKADQRSKRTWFGRTIKLMLAVYGGFVCYKALDYWNFALKSRLDPWFIAAVLMWGGALTVEGLYSLFRWNKPATNSQTN